MGHNMISAYLVLNRRNRCMKCFFNYWYLVIEKIMIWPQHKHNGF